MIIGVDLDGVIASPHVPALRAFNAKYAKHAIYEDIDQWETVMIQGQKFIPSLMFVLENQALHNAIPAIEGAADGMAELSKRHELVIVTSRPKTPTDWILDWLDINEISYKWLLNTGHATKKLLLADALIDDYQENLKEFQGHNRILFDQPWNQDYTVGTRVFGWRDIVEYI